MYLLFTTGQAEHSEGKYPLFWNVIQYLHKYKKKAKASEGNSNNECTEDAEVNPAGTLRGARNEK